MSKGDASWEELNKHLQEAMKQGNFSTMSYLYFLMAEQRAKEGKSFFEFLQLARKMELENYKRANIEEVEMLTAGDESCESCKPLSGKILKIEKALKEMPIPRKDCTHELDKGITGWCRCTYLPVVG